ncbi:histone-lysine N-methyltransferase SMYD3 [Anopheles bellator]|uniref:histone-lysine N-methyltransferase SMYD3 n=1 Tax=Anopheles bellator TaxID=139047 RepID=UPI0026489C89|nr:histone-lysine N-methyltransferase SMYD3 [Anopheles bellator]
MKKLFHKRGDLILEEQPFACVLLPQFRHERCDRCYKLGKVLKCSGCLYVRYCDRVCQQEAWPDHQAECAKLKTLPAGLVVPSAALMVARIIRRLQKGGDFQKGYYTAKLYRRFHDLMPHEEDIRKDTKRVEHFQAVSVVLRRLLDESAIPETAELFRIYGKMCINSFNIMDDDMNSIGTAMYLGASILDHSCRPNAAASFIGARLQIRLLEDFVGSELDFGRIFISYIDLLEPPDTRREQLAERYYFHCDCDRCEDEQDRKLMGAASCPNTDCKEPICIESLADEDKCPACDTPIKQSTRERFHEVTSFTRDRLAEMKDVTYFDVCRLCIDKQEGVLHPLNAHYLKTLENGFDSAIKLQKWDAALDYGARAARGYRRYCPYNPLFGLLLLSVGKIELNFGTVQAALKSLHEAEKILRVTHGEQHDLYKRSLVPLLCEAAQAYEMSQQTNVMVRRE